MNAQPIARVSCIVTNYNYGRYLRESIDSVLAQTRPVDELIVIDDGSTDESRQIIQRYGDRIASIFQSNQGVVLARNNGAKLATGDYIFFLDADDLLEKQFVELLLEAIVSAPPDVALAYCDVQHFGQDDHTITAGPWNKWKLLYRNYITVSALIQRQAFVAVGGFSEKLNLKTSFEDWDLWLSLCEKGYTGLYVPQTLLRYRLHGNGRNSEALKRRNEMESLLQRRHPDMYGTVGARLYLAVFRTASRIRNAVWAPPGT